MPLCRNSAFIAGFLNGQGVAAAADLQRVWCSKCLKELPGLQPDALYSSQDAADLDQQQEQAETASSPGVCADVECGNGKEQ